MNYLEQHLNFFNLQNPLAKGASRKFDVIHFISEKKKSLGCKIDRFSPHEQSQKRHIFIVIGFRSKSFVLLYIATAAVHGHSIVQRVRAMCIHCDSFYSFFFFAFFLLFFFSILVRFSQREKLLRTSDPQPDTYIQKLYRNRAESVRRDRSGFCGRLENVTMKNSVESRSWMLPVIRVFMVYTMEWEWKVWVYFEFLVLEKVLQ